MQKNHARYRHIFFDLDHTIWDFEANAKEAMADLFRDLKLNERVEVPFDAFYAKYLHHNEVLWSRYHNGFITRDELKWKRMWRTLLDFKIGDELLAREMSEAFLQILPTKQLVFPYTFEILDYLRGKDYRMHLITNGFEKTQLSKLQHSRLDKYFDEVITSEASNSMKPQKEIFDFALQKAGALLAESLMAGDNPEADILGAINAGMDVVFVNHTHLQLPENINPTYTITHLQQLEAIL